jgi:hypothetical protein
VVSSCDVLIAPVLTIERTRGGWLVVLIRRWLAILEVIVVLVLKIVIKLGTNSHKIKTSILAT